MQAGQDHDAAPGQSVAQSRHRAQPRPGDSFHSRQFRVDDGDVRPKPAGHGNYLITALHLGYDLDVRSG